MFSFLEPYRFNFRSIPLERFAALTGHYVSVGEAQQSRFQLVHQTRKTLALGIPSATSFVRSSNLGQFSNDELFLFDDRTLVELKWSPSDEVLCDIVNSGYRVYSLSLLISHSFSYAVLMARISSKLPMRIL